ncbi:MAG: AAA family ATPase [Lacipirellulaceae bacterium]
MPARTQKTKSRPFLSAPAAQRYFPASVIEDARLRLTQNIERSSGVSLVIAGAGLGKSMLLEVLAAQFASERPVITLAGAQLCTRRALLQMILFQLGLPFRDLTEGELRLSILTHLQSQASSAGVPSRLLLLVDEAESLPVRLLEELRVLTNVAQAGIPLVDLVLVGGPALEERLAEPELEALSQRLAVRCYLAPFGREETIGYIRSQVNAAGGNPDDYFTQDALEAMFAATDGIPRLVNQLGDQLAWSAEQTSTLPISAAAVQAAWAQIQQLPAPWNVQEEPLAVVTSSQPPSDIEIESSVEPAGEGLGEANVFEFGGEEEETSEASIIGTDEEAMPASIPFSRVEERTLEVSTDATIDATERLLAELGELGSSEAAFDFSSDSTIAEPYSTADESTSEPDTFDDPFGDGFDEEEIVIDQFGDFEPSMLAFAPDVMNFMDLEFAQELDTFAATSQTATIEARPSLATVVFDDETIDSEPLEVIEPTELDELDEEVIEEIAPVAVSELASTVTIVKDTVEEAHAESIDLEFAEPVLTPVAGAAPSKLLVLEDDGRGAVEIVPGRQFRRLFSTLEAGS